MRGMKKIFLIILVLGTFMLLPATIRVSAANTPIVNVDFPCPDGTFGLGNCPENTTSSIPAYLNRLYMFSVGIAGLLALGMIVAGGVYYTVSAGSGDKQREAKDMITSALWGVALLLGSYLILRTVNPEITKLNLSFTDISGVEVKKLTTKSSLEEQGVRVNDCPDFSKLLISPDLQGKTQFPPTCQLRKNILTDGITIDDDNYYNNTALGIWGTGIARGSFIWTYPYFLGDDPSKARCLVFAYREILHDTVMGKFKDEARLCPPQKQAFNVSCSEWTFTADDNGQPVSARVPVSSSFNYTDGLNPPPTGTRDSQGATTWSISPVPGTNICTSPGCISRNWTCTKTP